MNKILFEGNTKIKPVSGVPKNVFLSHKNIPFDQKITSYLVKAKQEARQTTFEDFFMGH